MSDRPKPCERDRPGEVPARSSGAPGAVTGRRGRSIFRDSRVDVRSAASGKGRALTGLAEIAQLTRPRPWPLLRLPAFRGE